MSWRNCWSSYTLVRTTWINRYQNVSILDFISAKDFGGGDDNWSTLCLNKNTPTLASCSFDRHGQFLMILANNIKRSPCLTKLAHFYWDTVYKTCNRQIVTINKPKLNFLYMPDALPVTQPTASNHWRIITVIIVTLTVYWIMNNYEIK